jgi:hypothetical protein
MRSFTSIHLEPLASASMGELLAGLVPGLPVAARDTIVARADGIPLYAVETVRMLLAQGRLVLDDGIYRPVDDLSDVAVPETLTALISARLDELDPAERSLVADAAVLGQSFTLAGLAAVAGVEPDALESRLRTLVRRELLVQEIDPRSPELGQYAFVQALIREVAYNTLAKRDRKTRHLAAAPLPRKRGSRCGERPSEPWRWARMSRRSRSWSTPSRSAQIPRTGPTSTDAPWLRPKRASWPRLPSGTHSVPSRRADSSATATGSPRRPPRTRAPSA